MSTPKPYQPTEEQLAIANAKKAERLKKKQTKAEAPGPADNPPTIKQRPWLSVPSSDKTSTNRSTIKVFTWNVSKDLPISSSSIPKHYFSFSPNV